MKQSDLLSEVRAYCEEVGISPSTLGVRALGNSRYFDRLERRIEKAEEDAQKLRAFMAEHPPQKGASSAA